MKELVSVVIPIYNMEEVLEHCIESAVNQTYRNIEIILIDDGSSDKSIDICKHWAENDCRIKYIRHENVGLGESRNKGITLSSGDYVTFLDADDWLEPRFIENILESMKFNNADIGICDIRYVNSGSNTSEIVKIRFNNSVVSCKTDKTVVNKSRLFAWGKLYKIDLLSDFCFPSFTYEDISVPLLCIKANKIAYVGEPLYNYLRQRLGSLSNDPDNIDDISLGLRWLFEMLHKLGYYDEYCLEYKKIVLGQLRFACRKWGESKNDTIRQALSSLLVEVGTLIPDLKDIAFRKYYLPSDSCLRSALDKVLPYSNQIVETPDGGVSMLPFNQDYFDFCMAEIIMERV
jgi:glycosyltransferase involved in cell wall biosynthesis